MSDSGQRRKVVADHEADMAWLRGELAWADRELAKTDHRPQRRDVGANPKPKTQASTAAGVVETPQHPVMLRRFDTDNPFVQRLFAHVMFGNAPDECAELLAKLETTDPEERLIAGLRVRHGLTEGGVLMVTTHWLRYVKHGRVLTIVANDEVWPLDGGLEVEAGLGDRPLFRTPDGNQFQVFPAVPVVSRRQAKAFLGIYRLAVHACIRIETEKWDAAFDATGTAPATVTSPVGSVAAELKELSALRDAGVLTEDEFRAAKSKALGIPLP